MIEKILKDLKEKWDFTTEELEDIRGKLINHGMSILLSKKTKKDLQDAYIEKYK